MIPSDIDDARVFSKIACCLCGKQVLLNIDYTKLDC